ncbi:MAG: bifunctional protein-serine/threonine kinase/phosphatase [Gammaproteobacteria bacterium]|jgi:serine/threonine protein phosphatase PrpC
MTSKLSVTVSQHSHSGTKEENQDSCGIRIPEEPALTTKGIVAVIADGVSSSSGGREASETCVQGFLNDYFSTPDAWSVKTASEKIIGALNRWLHGRGQSYYGYTHGMLSALSILIIKSTTAHIFHAGNTRIYHHRNGDMECLTRDHQTWSDSGQAFLTRAVGADVNIEIDYRSIALEPGDSFLLTTDGVYNHISHQDLTTLIDVTCTADEEPARYIVEKALEQDSTDNLTCQIIKIEQLDAKDEAEYYQQLTELPFPPSLENDTLLDGYRILKKLHAGRRTQIYLALDKQSNQNVIVKAPSANYEDDPQYINQFIYQEWAGKRISNKHVIKVVNPNRRKRFLYYVTEYVDGITLRHWMSEHPQPDINDVRQIARQIAAGLRAFHRLEMVHQDLKPENIMLDARGIIKIIDFGSTKIAGIAEFTTPIERVSRLATQHYSAPEYLLNKRGNNRSDIYSLGVMVYELLTGKLPYGPAMEKELIKKDFGKLEYQPVYHHNPMIPVWMDKAIEKAVKIDPRQRYGLLSEFISDISRPNEAFLKETAVPLIEKNPARFWQWLSVLLVLLNLFLVYLLLNR